MLTPNRLMKLDYSLLNVTAQVIACLLERPNASIEALLDYAKCASEQITESDVLLAVTFLYSTGKVDYCEDDLKIQLLRIKND